MRVALVNTNRIQPPIGPIGLDYLAEALHAAGHTPVLLDLCWEPDAHEAVARFFAGAELGMVGVTLRNTDDCGFTTRHSFLPDFVQVVNAIRRHTAAPIILGGVGFSTMPEQVLRLCEADAGIWGEGEFVFPQVAGRIERGEGWRDLVWPNPRPFGRMEDLPAMSRAWIDNPRYFREGGQAGFETKRGCTGQCIYCADPVAKGNQVRTRPPETVVDEIERLLAMGIDHLHTCDGEFNVPAWHAFDVCEAVQRRGLGARLRWYAYCSPAPFNRELAFAMRDAGCAGINFGADSGDETMLRRLRRAYGPEDIIGAAASCHEAGMSVMLDLLLGAPGETRLSLARTIELMKRSGADRIGISAGVRVYPGTELARELGVAEIPAEPVYHLEPDVAEHIFEWLDAEIAGDQRFLFFDPARPGSNYNYTANQVLVDAIRNGHRGAYWDILRAVQT